MTKLPFLLTVREVAEILRIQRAKVYILIQNGTLEAVKIGADWRVKLASVEHLVGPLPSPAVTALTSVRAA